MNLDYKKITAVSGAVILAVSMLLFGVTGLRFILGVALLFIVPTFLLLYSSGLEKDELFILSFLLGVGLVSYLVYIFDMLVSSLSTSMVLVFIFVSLCGYLLYRRKK